MISLLSQFDLHHHSISIVQTSFEARPFNILVFPDEFSPQVKLSSAYFSVNLGHIQKLCSDGFDFNRIMKSGIPFLTFGDEVLARKHTNKKLAGMFVSTMRLSYDYIPYRHHHLHHFVYSEQKKKDSKQTASPVNSITPSEPRDVLFVSCARKIIQSLVDGKSTAEIQASLTEEEMEKLGDLLVVAPDVPGDGDGEGEGEGAGNGGPRKRLAVIAANSFLRRLLHQVPLSLPSSTFFVYIALLSVCVCVYAGCG